MRCSKCGSPVEKDDQFCGECGAVMNHICPVCGSPVEPDDRFCGECGSVFSSQESELEATEAPNPPSGPKTVQPYENSAAELQSALKKIVSQARMKIADSFILIKERLVYLLTKIKDAAGPYFKGEKRLHPAAYAAGGALACALVIFAFSQGETKSVETSSPPDETPSSSSVSVAASYEEEQETEESVVEQEPLEESEEESEVEDDSAEGIINKKIIEIEAENTQYLNDIRQQLEENKRFFKSESYNDYKEIIPDTSARAVIGGLIEGEATGNIKEAIGIPGYLDVVSGIMGALSSKPDYLLKYMADIIAEDASHITPYLEDDALTEDTVDECMSAYSSLVQSYHSFTTMTMYATGESFHMPKYGDIDNTYRKYLKNQGAHEIYTDMLGRLSNDPEANLEYVRAYREWNSEHPICTENPDDYALAMAINLDFSESMQLGRVVEYEGQLDYYELAYEFDMEAANRMEKTSRLSALLIQTLLPPMMSFGSDASAQRDVENYYALPIQVNERTHQRFAEPLNALKAKILLQIGRAEAILFIKEMMQSGDSRIVGAFSSFMSYGSGWSDTNVFRVKGGEIYNEAEKLIYGLTGATLQHNLVVPTAEISKAKMALGALNAYPQNTIVFPEVIVDENDLILEMWDECGDLGDRLYDLTGRVEHFNCYFKDIKLSNSSYRVKIVEQDDGLNSPTPVVISEGSLSTTSDAPPYLVFYYDNIGSPFLIRDNRNQKTYYYHRYSSTNGYICQLIYPDKNDIQNPDVVEGFRLCEIALDLARADLKNITSQEYARLTGRQS